MLHARGKGQPVLREVVLRHIRREAPIAPTTFTFTPPQEAVPFERMPPAALLAAGTVAPDFAVIEAAFSECVQLIARAAKAAATKAQSPPSRTVF
jgi:hypothetical protein